MRLLLFYLDSDFNGQGLIPYFKTREVKSHATILIKVQFVFGGAEEIRTLDPLLAKQVL